MNKKQLVVTWTATILIVILLGSRTGTTYRLSEIMKPGGPENGHTSLFLYGNHVLSSENAGNLYPLLNLGEYKYHLITAVLILSALAIYTLRDNGRTIKK
jgi:hypothetical protein